MVWKSSTFERSKEGGRKVVKEGGRKVAKEAISEAVAKHQSAMSSILSDAKALADDRRKTLALIQDPELKRSAKR